MASIYKHLNGNNVIRFMIVSLYFIFMVPAMFGIRRMHAGEEYRFVLLLSIAMFLLFFAVELFEFMVLRYRDEKIIVTRVLFVFRIAALVAFWYFCPLPQAPLRSNPIVSSMIPLMVFYAYFVMKPRWSLLLLLSIIILITADYFQRDISVSFRGPDQISFLLFRTVVIVFFYLLAWFWESERRRRQENDRLLVELNASQEQLRRYAADVGRVVALEERTRLARDMHDSIGHSLTAIGVQLSKALAYFDVDQEQARHSVSAAHTVAKDAMGDVRESIGSLKGDDQGINLEKSLAVLVRRLQDTGLEVESSLLGSQADFNYSALLAIYRFLQEATTNILKHAHCRRVRIDVDLADVQAVVRVADDGVGFDVNSVDAKAAGSRRAGQESLQEHIGLEGLRRRFELVGGSLEIWSSPGDVDTTVLIARVPRNYPVLFGGKGGSDSRINS